MLKNDMCFKKWLVVPLIYYQLLLKLKRLEKTRLGCWCRGLSSKYFLKWRFGLKNTLQHKKKSNDVRALFVLCCYPPFSINFFCHKCFCSNPQRTQVVLQQLKPFHVSFFVLLQKNLLIMVKGEILHFATTFLHHLQSITSQCVLGIPSMVPLLHHSLLMTSLISCITYWWRHNVVLRIPGSSAEDNCLVSSKTVVEAVARQDNSLPTADLKLN